MRFAMILLHKRKTRVKMPGSDSKKKVGNPFQPYVARQGLTRLLTLGVHQIVRSNSLCTIHSFIPPPSAPLVFDFGYARDFCFLFLAVKRTRNPS